MSAILEQTKALYKKVIRAELFIFISISLLVLLYQRDEITTVISLVFGILSGFVPQCVLVFYVYFRSQSTENSQKTTALYQGEGIKFALTVLLISAFFILYYAINYSFFFAGFILALIVNNGLPLYFIRKRKHKTECI